MDKMLDFLSICGLLGLCLKLAMDGQLSPGAVAAILVAVVFVYAVGGTKGKFLKGLLALISLGYFLVDIAYTLPEFKILVVYVVALLVVLFGFYIMLKSVFGNR